MKKQFDVIVAGGGPAGINAALAAARQNKRVLLIEKYGFLGGMSTIAGVYPWMTFHSSDGTQVVKGIADEIVERLKQREGSPGHQRDTCGFVYSVTPYDGEEYKLLAAEMLHEEGVTLLLHTTLTSVVKEDNIITEVCCFSGGKYYTFSGKMFVDTTGDATLSSMADVPVQIGEKNTHKTQPMTLKFRLANVDLDAVKTYMLENPDNFLDKTPFSELEELPLTAVQGFYKEWKEADIGINRDQVLFFTGPHDNEVVVNMTRVQGLNPLDPLELTEAEVIARKQVKLLEKFFKSYIPGFENAFVSYIPPQIGIRESKRILGVYSMTKEDIVNGRKFKDGIATSGYPIDIHAPTGKGMTIAEVGGQGTFEIPFRALIPQKVDNLLVAGRCMSADHTALASVRLTPTAMATGQAAGTATALCIDQDVAPRELNTDLLVSTLRKNNVYI